MGHRSDSKEESIIALGSCFSGIIGVILSFMLLVGWLAGVVYAKGFWSTTIAVVFPPYGLYLTAEHLLIKDPIECKPLEQDPLK